VGRSAAPSTRRGLRWRGATTAAARSACRARSRYGAASSDPNASRPRSDPIRRSRRFPSAIPAPRPERRRAWRSASRRSRPSCRGVGSVPGRNRSAPGAARRPGRCWPPRRRSPASCCGWGVDSRPTRRLAGTCSWLWREPSWPWRRSSRSCGPRRSPRPGSGRGCPWLRESPAQRPRSRHAEGCASANRLIFDSTCDTVFDRRVAA